MDPDPSSMADYQLLGDGFGYHSGYGGHGSSNNSAGMQGSGQGMPPSSSMPPMMPGQVGPGLGQGYSTHPGIPPPPGRFDPSKGMHGMYSNYSAGPPPVSSYGSPYASPGMPGGPPSHLSMGGPPPPSSYPGSRLGMSSAFDQRAPPGIPPRVPAPIHAQGPYPGYSTGPPPPSMYGSAPTSSDPWGQPSPHGVPSRPGYSSYPGSSLRPQSGYPGQPDFNSSMMSSRPYYPGPGSDVSSPYPQSSFGPPTRGPSMTNNGQRQPSSYSFLPTSSAPQPPPSSSSSVGPSPRFPQQYPYGSSQGSSFSDPSSQSRMSPYGLQPVGPNSPGYRPPFSSSSVSQVSPRRPTPTPPSGSPIMPPTSRTPDRVTASVSQSSSSFPSPASASSAVSPAGGSGPPSNSLAQLEQMVGGNNLAPPNKTVVPTSSSSFYGQQGPPPAPPSSSGPHVYSHFPSASPQQQQPVQSPQQQQQQQPNYYSSYPPQSSGSWSSSTTPSSAVATNTLSSVAPNSVGFSPTNNASSQQSIPNNSSSSTKSPLNSGFSVYDNHYGSTAGDSFNSTKNDSSLSSLTPIQKSEESEPMKRDRKESDSSSYPESRNQTSPGSSFFSNMRQSSNESTSGNNSDPAKKTESSSVFAPSGHYDPSQGYMNQSMYPPSQQPYSQPMSSYGSGYNDSYDPMSSGMNDQMPSSYPGSYGQSGYGGPSGPPPPDNMMSQPSMGQQDYPGQMNMSNMSDPYEPSPYDEPFSSEPPTKKKGKGRPRKDPMEPKKEKKPRQPRVPKSPRGRGRGRGSAANMGDRMPPQPEYEPSGYSLPPPVGDHPEMYGHMHGPPGFPSQPGMSPGMPPPGMDPFRGPNMMPAPHMHPGMGPPPLPGPNNSDPNNIQGSLQSSQQGSSTSSSSCLPQEASNNNGSNNNMTNNNTNSIDVHPFDGVGQLPVPVPSPSMTSSMNTSSAQLSEGVPSSQGMIIPSQNSSDLSSNDVVEAGSGEEIKGTSSLTTSLSINAVNPDNDPCDDMFSQSGSNSQGTPLQFTLPPSEEEQDNSLNVIPNQESQDTSMSLPVNDSLNESVDTLFQNEGETTADHSFLTSEPEIKKGKGKGKGKGKKRKAKDIEEVTEGEVTTETFEVAEVKPPKAKKPKKEKAPPKPRKKKGQPVVEEIDPPLDSTIDADTSMTVDTATDADATAILDSSTVSSVSLDEGSQERDSALDPSSGDSLVKGKKGKGKGSSGPKTPKKPKLKDGTSATKKKLPKIALAKFKGRKKKKLGSDDEASDIDKTPPPSPDEAESGIQKRRSARNTKKTKYLDEVDIDLSGDEVKKEEDKKQETVQLIIDDTMVVEKIMATRMGTRELEPENEEEELKFKEGKPPTVEVEEFYVKYKNLSYLHCDWRTEEELEKGDKRVNQKIKRWKMKKDNNNCFDFLDDEPFNPDYCEVDRILDVNIVEEVLPVPVAVVEAPKEPDVKEEEGKPQDSEETKQESMEANEVKEKVEDAIEKTSESEEPKVEEMPSKNEDLEKPMSETETKTDESAQKTKEEDITETKHDNIIEPIVEEKPKEVVKPKTRTVRHYLVKWQALPYEESTWELEDDLDPEKVKQFWRFRELPSKEKIRHKKRPKAQDWKKLEESPVYKNGNTLREYQLEGLNWLTFCWHNNRNCILADEMGLGKTIQSLTFINEMVNYGIHSPYLVIVPLSTIGNWQREFETWTDLNVVTYHGSSASRNMLQEYEMYYKNEKGERIEGVYKFQVMITTFEIVLTDCLELRDFHFRACIIDEAHRLKNRNCKLLEGLRLLNMEHRVLLTGTPLQNNVEELFSLLNFLEPTQFSSPEVFMQDFGDLKTEDQVEKLQAILKPMMLRRLKEDVEKSLAPKEETIVEVELTNVQKKYYRAILERNFQFLSKGGTYANMPNLMNTMMELRKCCIHPFLIKSAEEQIMAEYRQQHPDNDPEGTLKCMVQASGKLVLMDKLLPRLKADGHRVLIFSQMVRCLDILEDYVVQKKYPYERIDGRVRGNLRQAAIDRYSKPGSDRFVFLLCTRAGGLGINLTAADTVIIFDSDWNPQNDLQAQARCHRIGQSKAVKIYRLICRNTYEREMFDKASLKLGLDKAVLQSMNRGQVGGADVPLSKKEVEELLRKGAYGAVMDDDNAADKFCEEDIDQILTRRTQVITIESGEKGSTFSKASFASSENADIEIDDPNFWEKWAKKANIDTEELSGLKQLIVQEPRRRTQTRRFGQDDGVMEMSEGDSSGDDSDNVSGRTRGGGRGRSSGKGKKGKKGRAGLDREEELLGEFGPGNWARSECFKIEKALLTYGWGRWEEFLAYGNFRRNLTVQNVEDVARTILLFSIQNYKGDEKIKSFIFELISPEPQSKMNEPLSPTIRGRKGRKPKKTVAEELSDANWASSEQYNPEVLLTDDQYRKHLNRHSNKLLLRVRLLFYLGNDIIGDLKDEVQKGVPVSEIPIPPPAAEGEPPSEWWDEECDKSLLIGVFKHGYDRYNLMRQDTSLSFFHKCGPPDGAALLAEIQDDAVGGLDEEEEAETPATPATPAKDESSKDANPVALEGESSQEAIVKLQFPSRADLNQRLRRLITSYQRHSKRQEIRLAQQARHQQRLEKLEKFEAAIKERDSKKRDMAQKKWSRREESDFHRVVSSYGIEFDRRTQQFDWNKFRTFSRLEKKVDDTLTEYFRAFYAMCKRVTGKRLTDEEENLNISVDPITEDRANRCLARIDLLSKIREEILPNPDLDAKLSLCQPSIDLPDWWVCGKHDKDLLIGAAKFGLNRLDLSIMHDPDLSFNEILREHEAETKKIELERLAAAELLARETPVIPTEETIKTEGKEVKKEEGPEEPSNGSHDQNPENEEQKITEAIDNKVEEPETMTEPETTTETKVTNGEEKLREQSLEDTEVDKTKVEEAKKVSDADEVIPEAEVKDVKSPVMNGDTNGHTGEMESTEDKKSEIEKAEEAKMDAGETKTDEEIKTSDLSKTEKVVPDKPVNGHSNEVNEATSTIDKSETETDSQPESETPGKPVADLVASTPVMPVMPQPKALRWPKDRVLQMRLEQIVYCVEKNEWPSMRHSFFSTINAPLNAPSVATGDSPRPVSPGSLSSASREPTPHLTPDHTPRRETMSPSLGDVYNFDSSGDLSRRRKRRRRRTPAASLPFDPDSEKVRLRSLLTQNSEHHQQQAFQQQLLQQREREQQEKSMRSKSQSQSLLNHASSLLPPNFSNFLSSLNLNNLPANLRNELLSNDKTASLLLEGLSRMQSQLGRPEGEQNVRMEQGSNSSRHDRRREIPSGSSGPPPAHQSSSTRRSANMETLDLTSRFKVNPILAPPSKPPTPAHHKHSSSPKSNRRTSPSPQSVLDLSSGTLPPKRSTRSHQMSEEEPIIPSPSRSGKRIGSRLDAIALNLQAKKMMQDPIPKGEPDFLSEISQKSDRRKDFSSLGSLDILGAHLAHKQKLQRQQQHQQQSAPSSRPSSSGSPSVSSKKPVMPQMPSINDILSGKMPDLSSLMDPKFLAQASKNIDMSQTLMEQTKGFKKWLEEHPEFLQQNPNLAAVAAAAMAGINPMGPSSSPSTSTLPANTELLELPEGRRRGRRPKSESVQPPPPPHVDLPSMIPNLGLSLDDNVPVIHRLTGKRISGPKAPPTRHLSEWLEKNPMFEIDPKWSPLMRDKFSDFKVPASVSPQTSHRESPSATNTRTRTSDRSRPEATASPSSSSSSSSSSKRTTAASLLAQAQSQSSPQQPQPKQSSSRSSSSSGSNPSLSFGFPGSGLNPSALAAMNPALFGLPPDALKMFMEQMTGVSASPPVSSSKGSSSSSGSKSNSSHNQNLLNPFLNFPGLSGMSGLNPALLPGFNLPGFPPGFDFFGATATPPVKSSKDSSDKMSTSSSSSSHSKSSEKRSEKSKSGQSPSSSSLFGSGFPGGLPFSLPPNMNPNLLYSQLSGLGGLSNLPGSPFGNLSQSGLMNGLGGLSSMTGQSSPSSSSNKNKSSSLSSGSKNSNKSGAPSGVSLSTASSLLNAPGIHPSSAAAAAAMGDSDDESLKSLMGHDEEDDLNGDMDDVPDKDDDNDSDYEARPKRKTRSKADKSRRPNPNRNKN